jgi:hypothetical protein
MDGKRAYDGLLLRQGCHLTQGQLHANVCHRRKLILVAQARLRNRLRELDATPSTHQRRRLVIGYEHRITESS